MKMQWTMKRLLSCILVVIALFVMSPLRTEAKTVALHTVFSQKQVDARIRVIRDYYYNKPDRLKIRKQKVYLGGSTFIVSYYLNGRDLMFGYGVDKKTEYRMYFYKNQMIRLLVDAPGKSRKTYTQSYKKLEYTFADEHLERYMILENYARKAMDICASPKNNILSEQVVMITKVSGNTIEYHKVSGYGSDGYLVSIGKTVYKAKVRADVKIEDYSDSPMDFIYRDMKWLKRWVSSPYLGLEASLGKKGTAVSEITVVYCP